MDANGIDSFRCVFCESIDAICDWIENWMRKNPVEKVIKSCVQTIMVFNCFSECRLLEAITKSSKVLDWDELDGSHRISPQPDVTVLSQKILSEIGFIFRYNLA